MTAREKSLTRFLKSRGFTWLLILVAAAASRLALLRSPNPPAPGGSGLWALSPDVWIHSPGMSWCVCLACCCAIGFLMVLLNRAYNLLRTVSVAFVGYFMVMQAATPYALTGFDGGELLAIVVLCSMMLLFSIFMEPDSTRRVFLVFFLLAAGAVAEYGFAAYIPVFVLGCYQMRVITLRTMLSALVGILTPVWILWGFGLIRPVTINLPAPPRLDLLFSRPEALPLTASVITTLIAGLYFGCANLIKVLAFNAKSRAFNGLLCAVGVATGLLCIIDFTNIAFYVTLLNAVTAMQAGLYMRLYATRRGYLALLLMLGAYAGCYVFTFLWA